MSLKNIGPFFKNFPEIGKEENQENSKEFSQWYSLYMDSFLRSSSFLISKSHPPRGLETPRPCV